MARRTSRRGPGAGARHAHAQALEALARILRALRAERGLSQRAAAAIIGIGPPVLRRMENGVGNPSLAVLLSVARAFDVPVAHLFGKRGKRE